MKQEEDLSMYAIALSMVQGVGGKTARKMVELAGGIERVFELNPRGFGEIKGIKTMVIESLQNDRVLDRAREEWKRVRKQGIDVLFVGDSNYPFRFARCPDAPVVLYKKGSIGLNGKRLLSIVGTRKCSAYGKEMTEKIVRELAEYNVIIVSGLAYGIDIAAHRAALKYELPTIACMAQGLDRIYPGVHAKEANQILSEGCWLSEFPTNHRPKREHFPARNRIIAGISDATLVVESDVKGGSMLTADLASSYHRDVMAVPGSVFSEKSKGPHALVLALKGSLVTSGNDIAKLMSWQKVKSVEQVSLFPDLSKDDLEVLSMLQSNPMHIDQLSMEYDHGRGKLMQVLLSMEMRGLVKTMPGSRYAVSGALEGIH
mgnify:CR=1 FL=1|jgi:DNA processing protein